MELQSLSELARKFVLDLIARGDLKPGQQIKEEEVSTALDISRPPVREAFKRLAAEGLVVSRPRRGVYVPEMTVHDAREIYFLKASLYTLSLELAMERFKPEDIDALKTHLSAMSACIALSPSDLAGYQQHHHAFHNKILAVSANDRLTKFASNLHLQIQQVSCQLLQFEEHLKESMTYHRDIMENILDNNREKACQLMKNHVLMAIDWAAAIMGPLKESAGNGFPKAKAVSI